jgi:hypothetical protein
MSAVPVYHPQSTRARKRTAAPRKPARAKAKPLSTQFKVSLVLGSVLTFAFVHGFSSLVGHALTEQARRAHIDARVEAREARTQAAVLREEVDRLSTVGALDRWARAEGFLLEGGRRIAYVAVQDEVL